MNYKIAIVIISLSVPASGQAEEPRTVTAPEFRFRQELDEGGPTTVGDGRLTLVHGGMQAWLVEARAGKVVVTPLHHKTSYSRKLEIKTFAFSADGRLVATGTGDVNSDGNDTCGEVYVWEVATGKLVAKSHKDIGEVRQLAFSRDGTKLRVDCLDVSGK